MVGYVEIDNQAERITVKPITKLMKIGRTTYEIGYHYKRKIDNKKGKTTIHSKGIKFPL